MGCSASKIKKNLNQINQISIRECTNFTEEMSKHFVKRMLHLIQKVLVFGKYTITIRSVEHNDN